jgi:pimeloyl-ACP methyl ester carboxylesterase
MAAVALTACGSDSNSPSTPTADAGAESGGGSGPSYAANTPAPCTVVVKDADCDKNQRPFVFVHGTYGFGANFAHVAALLASNGFCADRIVAIDYNSLGGSPATDGTIDSAINNVLANTTDASGHPFTQVDLAGHSQGTAHCGTYLGVPSQAAKVAHYINFSGSPNVGDVQTLSLSSMHDLAMTPHHACSGTTMCAGSGVNGDGTPAGPNVKMVTFTNQDHFAVAASLDSFVQVYTYLTGNAPKYKEVQCGDDPVTIEGVAERFADNVPVTTKGEIHELGTSPRTFGTLTPFMPDAKGHFGPLQVKRNVAYSFTGFDATGKVIGYSYFTPFKRSNRLVRLLTPADDGSTLGTTIAMNSTGKVTRSPNYTSVVALWAGGAFRQDLGASLAVNSSEVLTDANSGAAAFKAPNLGGGVVGFYMFDKNNNGKTDLGLRDSAAFQAFTDVFMEAKTPQFIDLSFTAGSEETSTVGEKLQISNWPSSDALLSVTIQ